jgi:dextranase
MVSTAEKRVRGRRWNHDGGASIVECRPTRALFHPGEEAGVWVRVDGAGLGSEHLRATVRDLDTVLAVKEEPLATAGQMLRFSLPAEVGKGYGVDLAAIQTRTGEVVARRSTSVDVQSSWIDAPRYGFVCEFAPGEQYEARADLLLERHVDVAQFYDWMYRHYQYLPPEDTFANIIGRTLSLSATRQAITALGERGIASMAYGSVYGAEPEYALQHRDELLYDEHGEPLSLDGAFYYQDVRPGPWRERVLREYRQAIERIGFDGIQADQYGFREQVHDASGAPIDMASALGDMVRAAQQTVRDAGGDGIIFNCVNNWPIRQIAHEPQLCTYVELWPPHVRLQDLSDLVNGARQLAPSRQVILAAYMSCAASAPDAAEEATLLTSAAIHASGGFHLLLGEGDGILTDPYFPNFVRPGPRFQRRLVDHWNFIVRYGAYLFDRSLKLIATTADEGSWRIHRAAPRFSTVSVLNAHPDELWDSVKPAHPPRNVTIDVPHQGRVVAVLLASPDEPGPPQRADFVHANGRVRFAISSVHTWTLAIVTSADGIS